MSSIRVKLLLLASLPLILTAAALVLAMHLEGRRDAREEFAQTAEAQFAMVSRRSDDFLQFQTEMIRAIASLPIVEAGNVDEIMPVLRRVVQIKGRVPWGRLGYFDVTGRLSDTSGATLDARDRPYFKEVMAGRSVTAAVQSLDDGTPVIITVTPVRNSGGRVTGGVGGYVTVRDFVNAVVPQPPSKLLLMLALDDIDGTVVTFGSGTEGAISPQSEFGGIVDAVRNHTGMFETTFKGQEVLVYTSRLPYIQWPFAFLYPAHAAYDDVTRFEWITIGLLIMALFAVMMTVRYASRSFLAPITQLLEGFRRVGRGTLETRLIPGAKDELGDLTRSFNDMVANLQRAEARSQEEASEKEKLLTIIERTPHAVGIADVDGAIFYTNPAAREMLRMTGREPSDLELQDLLDANGKGILHEVAIPHALRYGVWTGDAALVARDNTTFPASMTLICHREDGVPIYFSFIARDISRAKAMEAQLRAALERAEQANRVKDAFLQTLSHELLTPLSMVAASLELLEEGAADKRLVLTARKGADRLKALFSRLFLFLDLITSRAASDEVPFSLSILIDEILGIFASEASEKKLALEREVAADVHDAVIGDKAKLGAALSELLSNAIKFTSEGTVRLTVKKLRDMKDRDFVRFSIEDTGVGISRENREMIFQSFHQGDASLTRRHGGIGLGLALVKLSVTALNGELDVESQVGVGSRFCLDVVLKRQTF